MRLLYALAAALLFSNVAARADAVFNVQGTFVFDPGDRGGTLTGTLTFNSATGSFSAVNLNLSTVGQFTSIGSQGEDPSGVSYFVEPYLNPKLFVRLEIPDLGSLAGYGGSSLCSTSMLCSDGMGGMGFPSLYRDDAFGQFGLLYINYLQVGSLTPQAVSVTPECSGLALAGTGLVGLVGAVRRRVRQSKA